MSDSHATPLARLERYAPSRLTLLWGALLVLVELLWLLLYFRFAPVEVYQYRIYLYPFVWINVGLWALATTDPPSGADPVHRRAARMVAAGYFLLLSYAGGVVAAGYAIYPSSTPGFYATIETLPPGFAPLLLWNTPLVKVTISPYQVVGYVALAYLVYVLVLDTVGAGSAFGGVLGLLSCVSCSWPVLATLVAGVFGSGSALAAAANSDVYGLSTLVFVVTVALLSWRPTFR